jgi:hypothetical protein
MMNVYEGNISELWGADGYFGGSGYGTALRNYITGWNPYWNNGSDAIRLLRGAYDYNVVGNIIWSSLQSPGYYDNSCGTGIYSLGYPNIGNCSTVDGTPTVFQGVSYPDASVKTTLLRWGNYDYFNKAARFVASEIPTGVTVPTDQVIPNSYYYSAIPAWWPAVVAWPPIGPDVTGGNGDTSGHVNKIPAQVCWETRNLLKGTSKNSDLRGFVRV